MSSRLKNAFNDLEERVTQRTYELAKANEQITHLNHCLKTENTRMSAELEVTRKLQQMLLPKVQELENIQGLEIAVFMEPASEVGGDYYDVLQHDGRIKIAIGDITGHGLESGVLMLMVQTAVRTLLANNVTDPKTFLNVLNCTVYENVRRMQSDKNLTLSLLDYQEGNLRLTGQHEEVLIVRAVGKIERIDTIDLGFIVGVEADIGSFVAQMEVHLNTGDGVVLYTDGITEARNEQGKAYGLERLCNRLTLHWDKSALEIQHSVIEDLRQFIGSRKPIDDITLLIFKQK